MQKHGPWVIKNSIEKYKNKWINVTEHEVIRPDGKDGIFGIVEMMPGISILPIDDEGYVYLTKEFRFALGCDSVEVVSGGIAENESPIHAAKKELKEELGIESSEIIELGIVNPFTSVVKSPAYLFLAKNIKIGQGTEVEGTEIISEVKIKFEDAVNMVMEGEITHGPSCVLILKAYRYFTENSLK
jgi:8-oxo-dGTP pyrophosphatase MutT (NUDIX family)